MGGVGNECGTMDFLGSIISGLFTILGFMLLVYVALHNPAEVTALVILFLIGSILFLVRG